MTQSPWGEHKADLATVCCVDDRIQEVAAQYVRTRLSPRFFCYAMPGGAFAVTKDWAAMSQALRIAVERGAKRIALVNHVDCASFPPFASEEEELRAHRENLAAARGLLAGEFPGVSVICILMRGRWHFEEV